ncbi:MAG TPA: Ig-like domain-containing protein [Candidatus Acidoferrales bacterium]|nr:Ig-like domain-containing protein [Candidatus Acidoferrales bacterium]
MRTRSNLARCRFSFRRHLLFLAAVLSPFVVCQTASSQTVVLSPTSLSFGSVAVGTSSAAKRITLTNSGSAVLTITSIIASASYTETNTCGHSVPAKKSCVISVSFAPTVTGTNSGTITITDNAGNSPQTASLTGTGTTTGLLSIAVTPANPSVAAGSTQQFTATGTFTGYTYNITDSVTWTSTKSTVATISNTSGTQGLATTIAAGTSTIKAASGRIVGSTPLTVTAPTLVSIAITPSAPSIALGAQQQFTATGTYSDNSTQNITTTVTWTSSISTVATISNTAGTQGLATSVAAGTSTISATLGSISGSTTLTVTSPSTAITTYHYDNYRTGWNQNETILNPGNVNSSSFGLLATVPLDNQVDAQPLVVPGVNITAGDDQGTHDVVYVATQNNTVYAIDAESGDILLSPNFGPPVMYPTGCQAPYDGINSTPVIDLSTNTMYVMVYTNQSTGPAYYLHALDLGSLTDKGTPVLVTASHLLTDGSTFEFNATYQRQRPALLLSNGTLYAAFGSFCNNALSRGWLLGWQTATLDPLTAVGMTDTQATDPDNFFATSIWMSGYGPATDDSGNILYVTGNSDYSGTTYDGVTNIPNSVVKESPDLSSVLDLFTPSNEASLDQGDRDFGSGGVMVLPDQPGTIPHLAVAAGKDGRMFLMNEDSLGGYSSHSNNVLGTYQIGMCWCGPSYYVDPTDLTARVVTSGGEKVEVWKLQSTPNPTLTMVTSGAVSGAQDPGFFTTISSSGTSNPIIWALARPLTASQPLTLYAFNPDAGGNAMSLLWQGSAGSWPIFNNNANLVPVVANGEVFVASYQQLQILGLTSAKRKKTKK